MSADPPPAEPREPPPAQPLMPQPGWPPPAAWPQGTRPQTWPEQPTVPGQPAASQQPPAWPQQPPRWPQQPPPGPHQQAWQHQQAWPHQPPWPQQQPAWPQQPPAAPGQAGPGGPAGPGQERYAIREQPQQYGLAQPQEWAPLPMQAYGMQPMTVAPKSSAVSVLLSVFVPGLGSMVNDNVPVGVAILVLNIIGLVLSLVLIGIPLAIGTWIWGLVDAHQSAQRWNRQHGIIN